MRCGLSWLCAAFVVVAGAQAQVTVNPTGVNVASQGATTVFLTFGGLGTDLVAAEAFWCGELMPAAPHVGQQCDPTTLFGRLPARFDLARPSGSGALTDIMSIPPSVVRRAYQAAAAGAPAAFFYVRRFASRSLGPDVYVAVTCRLTSGGAGTPLSLVGVSIVPEVDDPVLILAADAPAPGWHADLMYTGTGRLRGRWEVVLPGEELPSEQDLLAEGALPLELRGSQRTWMLLERFDVFLPPTGRARLPGPDPARLPRQADGAYLVLLRIEASDDRDSRSDLGSVAAGDGIVASGAVAGFPMPTLRYYVGSGMAGDEPATALALIAPDDDAAPSGAWRFVWRPVRSAARQHLEIAAAEADSVLFEAVLGGDAAGYRPPPFLADRIGTGVRRWRVRAFGAGGEEVARSRWNRLIIAQP